jgi:type II secretory pathway pseudopilin PulG
VLHGQVDTDAGAVKPMHGPDAGRFADVAASATAGQPALADPRADRRGAREGGFTFVELLVALTILLFSVVALTGLMSASLSATSAAQRKSALVNAAAGYLERVRQESFSKIGTPGGNPSGDLVPTTVTDGPYALVVTPSVAWGRPEDPTNQAFKTVTLTITTTGGTGPSATYTSSAIIGASGSVTTVTSAAATPTAAVVAPATGSAVWGSAASVTVSATANSASRTLSSIGLYDVSTVIGLTVASGQTASAVFAWNTTSAREGPHALTRTVTDSTGKTTQGSTTNLLVDNAAPGAPTAPGIDVPDGGLRPFVASGCYLRTLV